MFPLVQDVHSISSASHSLLLAVGFAIALLTSMLLTRALRTRAHLLGLSEAPRHLGPDAAPVAKIGGIAIALTIGIVGTVLWAGVGEGGVHVAERTPILAVLGGAIAMVMLGVWDDLRELRARTKLLIQVATAATVWVAGVRFGGFAAPGGLVQLLPVASLLVTVFWFVALSNAFNLVDGADGVAGGAALTATLAMFIVSMILDQSMAAFVLAVTAGAVVGFLFYNFPPASVYLGDAGSLSIGFLLAGIGLVTAAKATTLLAVAIPVVSLGLPILDTSLAVVRRTIRGESIAMRDLGHIHHRLAHLGHSPRRVALTLFAASAVLALASLLLLTPDMRLIGITYAVLGVAAFVGLQRLKMPEFLELRRAIVRGLGPVSDGNSESGLGAALAAIRRHPELAGRLESLAEALADHTDFLAADIRIAGQPDDPDAVLWRWQRADRWTVVSSSWEGRVPLLDDGVTVGWVTISRPHGSYASTDVSILAASLWPALNLDSVQAQPDLFSTVVHEEAG